MQLHAGQSIRSASFRRLRSVLPAGPERVVGDSYSSRAMSWLQKSPDEPPQASQMPGIAPATSQVQQIMAAQEAELAFMTEFYNNIVDVCYKKCIVPKFHDSAMNVGEKSCTERCVSKYIAVHVKVGEMMAKQAQQQQM